MPHRTPGKLSDPGDREPVFENAKWRCGVSFSVGVLPSDSTDYNVSMKLILRHAASAAPVEVRLEPLDRRSGTFVVCYADQRAEIRVNFRETGGWLHVQDRVVPFQALRSAKGLTIRISGKTYFFELADPTAQRTTAAGGVAARRELSAPMPGTILRIRIAEGATFDAHQPLIILESMKMEMTLSVPHPGRVSRIFCHTGQLVDMGAVLVELEPADEKPLPT